MKRVLFISAAAVLLFAYVNTTAFSAESVASISVPANSFIKYDFGTVEEQRDTGSRLVGSYPSQRREMTFEPVDVRGGWLTTLAGSGNINAAVGTLNFNNGEVIERYIDIRCENGDIRLLQNSSSSHEGYTKTLFWSAKRHEGSSVVKDFSGEIKCAVLFELPDGSCYLYGYTDGDGTNFWSLKIPPANYYSFINRSNSEIENNLAIIMSSPNISSNSLDYINAHKTEYEEIIAMADSALPYLYSIWKADRGLRGTLALTAIFDICPDINIRAVLSPNGKYLAETSGINFDNQISGIYPADEIRIMEWDTQKIVWSITPGYLDTDYAWSQDSRYLAISYLARTYRETIVLDTYNMSLVNIPQMDNLQTGLLPEPKEDRADPYFSIVGWEDNTSIRISFKWTGKDENEYTGEYVYDLHNKRIVEIKK